MEKSPKSGIHSSPLTTTQSSAGIAALTQLAQTHPVSSIAEALGSDADLHIVGGTVRDLFDHSHNPTDIDLASALSPEELLKRLEDRGFRVIATGLKHGTITCAVDGMNIEITTFRAGKGGRGGSIQEDLAGRDFTINAIAFSIQEKKLVDSFNGLSDIEQNILRAVGDPKDRYNEDPLRILRMIRFGYAQGRGVDEQTSVIAKDFAEKLKEVSVERIRTELEKIIMGSAPAEGVRALYRHGLLPYTWPELIPTIGFEQNRFHVHDVFDHTLDVLERCPPERILRLAAVYHDIGKAHTLSVDAQGNRHFYEHERVSAEICKESMQRLKFSNEDIEAVTVIVRLHMRPFDCGPSGVRRLMRDLGPEYPRWREFKNADRPAVFDDDLLEQLKVRFDGMVETELNRSTGSVYSKLALSGDDLIALGLKPGKFLGGIIKELQNLVIEEPDLNQKEVLLERAKKIISERAPE